jgi:hypothetical protein
MKPLSIILMIVVVQAAGCSSRPSVSVSSSLGKHGLKGKTLAVGGFTAQSIMDYPGQVAEETIVNDAGTALQHRFKHSRVLTAEAAWAAAGPPPIKINSGVPITLGHKLTRDFMRRTHAQGVDYLLWIDLMDNTVRNASSRSQSTRRTSSSTLSRGGRRFSSPGSYTTTYYSYEAAGRSLGASYSLLDTASGKSVWRAECLFSRAKVNSTASMSGYPMPPSMPLPPEESVLMRRMTTAVIAELPK